jgi:hypothetical protein
MGGGVRSLKAATLVNRDVYQDSTRLHLPHHLIGNQLWSALAGDQHRANY